jgi:hypothetical protein
MGPRSLADTAHTPPLCPRQLHRALASNTSLSSTSTTAGKTPLPPPPSRGINIPNTCQGNTRSPSLASGHHLSCSDHQNDKHKPSNTRTHLSNTRTHSQEVVHLPESLPSPWPVQQRRRRSRGISTPTSSKRLLVREALGGVAMEIERIKQFVEAVTSLESFHCVIKPPKSGRFLYSDTRIQTHRHITPSLTHIATFFLL